VLETNRNWVLGLRLKTKPTPKCKFISGQKPKRTATPFSAEDEDKNETNIQDADEISVM